ncbi:glycoside hydrolase family 1 protein [Mangrovibacterium diazotrophicum]|uniref:beta-glucosidase n=1 Tax=Mangrovibacterium diazotrophicum TaxID=1261403 RepID=A0A419W5A1_9BACT|nr:family 1 glycosylhydrolase [Mangrovibacterium diazotrophicum]RKD90623.1 broad-specificity cellobiase [Mangrovibacterium diazotrophicum]
MIDIKNILRQMGVIVGLFAVLVPVAQVRAQEPSRDQFPDDFMWGVASAAYQVEGAWQADDKGESKWDFFTNTIGVTQFTIGEKQTANVTINQYDREQYLKDIQLIKELGINTYRFSIPWSRIIPQGAGEVNPKAIAHYHLLIEDLKEAGIEPLVTLYHFDLPLALLQKGGWLNRESVQWYKNYAKVIFENFGNEVSHFITFNEPYIEFFVADFLMNPTQSQESASVRYATEMDNVHHQLLASAEAIKLYHEMGLNGQIGITFNLSPCLPFDTENQGDVEAVSLQDDLLNRIMLDPVFKGKYPDKALTAIQKYNPDFHPSEQDMQFILDNQPDFLGINFYAPALVKKDDAAPLGVSWMGNNTDAVKMANGPARPEELYNLLIRIKREYGDPEIIITENGASFENGEDKVVDGNVNDTLRTEYLLRHIAAAEKAVEDGVKLKGYCVWSGWDNFEWIFGYSVRFGLIHVDFDTQLRTPKSSYYWYQSFLNKQ